MPFTQHNIVQQLEKKWQNNQNIHTVHFIASIQQQNGT